MLGSLSSGPFTRDLNGTHRQSDPKHRTSLVRTTSFAVGMLLMMIPIKCFKKIREIDFTKKKQKFVKLGCYLWLYIPLKMDPDAKGCWP